MKLLDYVYYKYFLFFRLLSSEMPGFISMMAMCWLMFMNVYTLVALLTIKFNLGIVTVFSNKAFGLGIVLAILTFSYLRFSHSSRHKEIIERYSVDKFSVVGSILVIIYTGVSFWICLVYVVPFIGSFAPSWR